jgi:hypothetical protein
MTEARWKPLSIGAAVRVFDRFEHPWWIAGGRAIELFVGRPLRTHGDLDVLVLRPDQGAVRQLLEGWDLRVAHAGRLEPWPAGARLELPHSSLWCRRDADGPWELQILLGEAHDGVWWSRRAPSIRLPVGELGLVSATGIPYLRPEILLLFKAKKPRVRDEIDFEAALAALPASARARLRSWLPGGHPWRRRL